jgi:cytochrome c553
MRGKSNFGLFGVVALAAALNLCTTPLHAQSIEEKTAVCAGCHGADGKPVDKTIPNIWGQHAGGASKEITYRASGANRSVGCTGCHLDHFQGDGTVPRLAGLSREYLAKTMADFRTRARGNNPGMSDLMLATAPEDLAALAEYLSGL